MMDTPAPSEEFTLEMSRWYDAPVASVFRAFTEPELLRQWWGPRDFVIEQLDFSAVAGRSYRVVTRAPDGTRYVHVGEFLSVDPPSRLSYSWRWIEGPMQPGETLVELSFRSELDGTRVELRHSRFPDAATRDAHSGWFEAFERFQDWLAAAPLK